VTYDSDIASLARATAALVISGDGAPHLRGAEPPAAMACRDALVTALRGGLEALTTTWRHDGSAAQRQVSRDLKELSNALNDLAAASPGGLSLGQALTVRGGPLTGAWQRTAVEAVALEVHRGRFQPSQVPAAARDLAELAATLPLLDGDLATALPSPPQALTDVAAPARVALAAEALRHVPGEEASPTTSAQPALRAIPMVRSSRGLPRATRHLAELIERRGSELTVAEVRAAARLLADGLVLSHRLLGPTAVEGAAPALRELMHGQTATLTRPSAAALDLVFQSRRQLANAQEALNINPPASQSLTSELRAIAAEWLPSAAALTQALETGVRAVGRTGGLLVPRQDTGKGPDQAYLWRRVPPAEVLAQPVVRATTALTRAFASYGRASGDGDAATALRNLRVALTQTSTGDATPTPTPAHLGSAYARRQTEAIYRPQRS